MRLLARLAVLALAVLGTLGAGLAPAVRVDDWDSRTPGPVAPLVLPEGGDARDRKRNDQSARVMVVFEGMKAVAYLWDTTAPAGTEVEPDELEMFQRVLIVVRSGPDGVGGWHRHRRNIHDDYVRVFGEEPNATSWVGFESHSNDTHTRSAVLFGAASFEPR